LFNFLCNMTRKIHFLIGSLGVFLYLGCGVTYESHYIKSATTAQAELPIITSPNLYDGKKSIVLGMNARYSPNDRLVTTSDTSYSRSSDPFDNTSLEYRPVPNNYHVYWNSTELGLDFKFQSNEYIDLFLKYNANLDYPAWSHVGAAGGGLTLPFPWLAVRLSPAIAISTYETKVMDSVNTSDSYSPDTSYLITRDYHKREITWMIGFTAWFPPTTHWPLFPYVGYQSGDRLISEDDYLRLLSYSDTQWLLGIHYYAGKQYSGNLTISRNEKFNKNGGAAYYKFGVNFEYIIPLRTRTRSSSEFD
ncbi:MAG TPA: hypothetical protein DCQ83_09400, partial [Fibrobacteres bacterium]|nr:hypothetical protein [Fibrobacterota bacterium]